MNRDARDNPDEVAKRTPLGRIGRDEDMAGAAIYLASKAGDYVVGDTIAVDGGIAYSKIECYYSDSLRESIVNVERAQV